MVTTTVIAEVLPPVGVKVNVTVPAALQPEGSEMLQAAELPDAGTPVVRGLSGVVMVTVLRGLCATATLVAAVPALGTDRVTGTTLETPLVQLRVIEVGLATSAAPCSAPVQIVSASSTRNT